MARWPAFKKRNGGRGDGELPDEDGPDVSLLLEAFAEPLLLLQGVTVTHANGAARTLLGGHVVGDDVRLTLRQPSASALIAGNSSGTTQVSGLGGAERRWELRVTPMDDDRRLIRLEDRSLIQASERMRVDFVANASHELRTPLAALSGFIETLEEANGPGDAATRSRFLKIMAGEARRMQRLIDDLMSLSRIEADRFVAPRERLDLTALVRIACAEIEAGNDNPGRLHCPPDLSPTYVLGDQAQLSQLVHNIVGNALKYGRPGSPVRITLATDEREARLSVADEGEGIAPEHLPRLTERFYRVDAGRSRTLGGTGLGLAIVKHIVERHRGRLDIASTRGVGTTVTVTLPLAMDPL